MPETQSRAAPARRERKREVACRLAENGLRRGPHRLPAAAAQVPDEDFAAHLARALAELGGGFAAFGRYLASRADLFAVSDCRVLAAILGPPAAAAEAIEERLRAELGAGSEELFARFAPEPFQVGLFDQAHRARQEDGKEVVVRVVPPGSAARVQLDLELLPMCRRAFPDQHFPLAEMIADFKLELAPALDLGVQAEALRALAGEAAGSRLLAVPEVLSQLSTTRVLTLEDLGGAALEQLAAAHATHQVVAYEAARHLVLVFFRQALAGRRFPLAVDAVALDDGRVAILGGVFAEAAGQAMLREYLDATAKYDSERLTGCLLQELGVPPGSTSGVELARRLRQRVPGRDGVLSLDGESLVEHLLLHWRQVRECRLPLEPRLLAFYRGVFRMTLTARSLAPPEAHGRDLPQEALTDQRWLTDWEDFQQFGDPVRMAAALEGYLTAFSVLPQQIDRILDARQAPSARPQSASGERRANASVAVTSLGLVMAALVLVVTRLSTLAPDAGWQSVERLGTLIFLALGALLLRVATRRGDHTTKGR